MCFAYASPQLDGTADCNPSINKVNNINVKAYRCERNYVSEVHLQVQSTCK